MASDINGSSGQAKANSDKRLVFGKPWAPEAVDTLLASINTEESRYRQALIGSPDAEMQALVDALNGRFVEPGKGNDPIRTPEALPTGRNFHALDSSLIPSRIGWVSAASWPTVRDSGQWSRADARPSFYGRPIPYVMKAP